ncbi:MAG: prolyl oligopeptidase family serine peptidase [Oscillospiraceae bacterium]|jgi:acetyl esterase/lipase|nr:prolyl oligopeptidase family serine peptidase [Oscillospiraceae bacterium]
MHELIPPYLMSWPRPPDEFPESPEKPDGCVSVTWTDRLIPMVDVAANVVYQSLGGEDQHLQIISPMDMFAFPDAPANGKKYPLVMYVPGSAWHRQNVWMVLPRAIEIAGKGYVVALVEYRPTDIGATFPAQCEDVKAAIRFMQANAETYKIDTERVAIWGDSSGGHTGVCVAVDSPELVRCVVDWFGPTDIGAMSYYPSGMDHHGADSPEGLLIGGKDVLDNPELARELNPITRIAAEKPVPPILIMHGSRDMFVPFNQSVRLYEKLKECGKDVRFYKLEGGGHGYGGFNSPEALRLVLDFLAEKL